MNKKFLILYDEIKKQNSLIDDTIVNIYVCGPTVYSYSHIGNIRSVVVFDILIRYLKHINQEYKYVHNITDVDDKIIAEAKANNLSEEQISNFFLEDYIKTLKKLNIIFPDHMPKITNYINPMLEIVQKLLSSNKAYLKNGDCLFDLTNNLKYYNLLTPQKEARDISEPLDFVLWKKTSEGIKWESPVGLGRPGWHTECATLIDYFFDHKSITIHGGGTDLKFPHHENENIIFCALNNETISKYWLHVGYITDGSGEKHSKSKGNIFTNKDFLDKFEGNILRFLILNHEKSKPMQVNENAINTFAKQWKRIELNLLELEIIFNFLGDHLEEGNNDISTKFIDLIQNNLNYMHAIFLTVDELNKVNSINDWNNKDKKFKKFNELFNQFIWLGFVIKKNNINSRVLDLIKDWAHNLNNQNFDKSDLTREKIINLLNANINLTQIKKILENFISF